MEREKNIRSRHGVLPVIFYACIFFLLPAVAFAQSDLIDKGRHIFNTKCIICHTIGGGKKVGPGLQGVTVRREKQWLAAFISDPDKLFAKNDPIAAGLLNEYKIKMPNLGLTPDEVSAVISYLETRTGAAQAPPTEAAPTTPAVPAKPQAAGPAGNPAQGKMLFSGQLSFKNGGPPCLACHTVSGIKFLGGGNLGPDLTKAYAAYGDGLITVLTNIPFPTMRPVFEDRPLTDDEKLNLEAYFKESAALQPMNFTPSIITVSGIAFVVVLIVIALVWRNRLLTVRKSMVKRALREVGRT